MGVWDGTSVSTRAGAGLESRPFDGVGPASGSRRGICRGELGRVAVKRQSEAPARAAVLPFPHRLARRLGPRLAPSRQSLAVGLALVIAAAGAYALARETSLFAVRAIDVRGAPKSVAAQVERAVADVRGTSLVGIDGDALLRRVELVPSVATATYDRAFPRTLIIVVQSEHPVAVIRQGRGSWLVSARGRVVARLQPRARPELPRIWVARAVNVDPGSVLADAAGGAAARALASLVAHPLPERIATVALAHDDLVFSLRSGVQLRLGRLDDLRLKLAIARRILPTLRTGYLDLSVAERPVAGANSRLSGTG